jgi:glycerate kinase
VVGIGGSASTDGGAGMVAALGGRLLDAHGAPIADGVAGLSTLHEIDLAGLHPALAEADVVVACDVDNPLTGPRGAAAVYGPQKGAAPPQVAELDRLLGRWADLVTKVTVTDRRHDAGAGAAGGVGYAALALLGASLQPGIGLMLDLLGFDAQVAGAELVVTGEGSLDEQSLNGKAPVGVAEASLRAGVPVVAVCGRRQIETESLHAAGIEAAYALSEIEPDPDICMRDAPRLLEQLAPRLLAHLPASPTPE